MRKKKLEKLLPYLLLIVGIGIGLAFYHFFIVKSNFKDTNENYIFKKSKMLNPLETDPISKNDANKLINKYNSTGSKKDHLNSYYANDRNYDQVLKDVNNRDSTVNFKETRLLSTDIASLLDFLSKVYDPNDPNKAIKLNFHLGQYDKNETYDSLKVKNNQKRYNGKLTFIMKAVKRDSTQVGESMDVMSLCPPDCN